MPKLTDTLSDLLTRLAAGEKAPSAKLGRGLVVLARQTAAGRQLVLNRPGTDDAWKLKTEADTCAKHAGWSAYDLAELVTAKGGHCLTVTEKQAQATAAQRKPLDERGRLIGLLTCVSLRFALINPGWFARAVVIGARRAAIQNAKTEDLWAEVKSHWGRLNIRLALPYVLLVCRWQHMTRALPAQATAAKVRRPRKKAVAA